VAAAQAAFKAAQEGCPEPARNTMIH
jgi:hypothetical protein